MILDLRMYTCRPGMMQNWLNLYADAGYEHQVRHCGEPLLYASSDVGPQNQVVHVWRYESHADRDEKRVAMLKDPGFARYMKLSQEMAAHQSMENRILTPCEFEAASR